MLAFHCALCCACFAWLKEGVRKWTLCWNLRQQTIVRNSMKFSGKKKKKSLSYIFVKVEFGLWAVGLCLGVKPRDFHLCSSGQYQGIQDALHGVEQLASDSVDFCHV